jgi:hypothetical protein
MCVLCVFARRVILADIKIKDEGDSFFVRLLERHARFLALPKPLRGKALDITASELGLVTRVETMRVDVSTIKEECLLARSRKQMNMHAEIGKQCEREVVHKKKRKECIQRIVEIAQQTGVADVTRIWREFSACSNTMVAVALEAIVAVCSLKTVYVLDIQEQKDA